MASLRGLSSEFSDSISSAVAPLPLLVRQPKLTRQGSEYHWLYWLLLQGLPEEVPTLQQPPSLTHERLCGQNGHELLWRCT